LKKRGKRKNKSSTRQVLKFVQNIPHERRKKSEAARIWPSVSSEEKKKKKRKVMTHTCSGGFLITRCGLKRKGKKMSFIGY
jgi:hypothetical protein